MYNPQYLKKSGYFITHTQKKKKNKTKQKNKEEEVAIFILKNLFLECGIKSVHHHAN